MALPPIFSDALRIIANGINFKAKEIWYSYWKGDQTIIMYKWYDPLPGCLRESTEKLIEMEKQL